MSSGMRIDEDERAAAKATADDSDAELDRLLADVYACTRVWEAWSYGTMTEADFEPAAETDIREALIAWRDAAVAAAMRGETAATAGEEGCAS